MSTIKNDGIYAGNRNFKNIIKDWETDNPKEEIRILIISSWWVDWSDMRRYIISDIDFIDGAGTWIGRTYPNWTKSEYFASPCCLYITTYKAAVEKGIIEPLR